MRRDAVIQGAAALIVYACAFAATPSKAQDQSVAHFFKGKQISLYIGSAVGGGFDTYGRLVSRYIGAHIPGQPTVVPVNMPGASGMVVVSHLLTSAPRDGTAIAAIQPDNVTAALLTNKTAPPFQARRLVYLGSAENEDAACWVRTDAGVTFKSAFKKPVLVGSSAPGGNTFDLPTIENNILGTQFKIVTGYAGVNEVLLAVDRNEVHGVCGVGPAAILTQRPAWVSSGFVKMLVQENSLGRKEFNEAGVPRTTDFAKTPQDRAVLNLIYAQQQFGRPFVMPPGAPPAIVAALRRAFLEALADKSLLAEAKRIHLDIEPMAGSELQTIVNNLYKTPPDVVQKAKLALSAVSSRKP